MAFKPLDLQMSIPRTQDVSIIKSQAAQKPVVDQNSLAQQAISETEKMRAESSKLEKSAKSSIKDQDRERSKQQEQPAEQAGVMTDAKQAAAAPESIHPYKGHHLDISL